MLARGEAEQVKGTSGQGDKVTRGGDREAKRYRGAKRQGDKIQSQKFRVGGVGPSGI